MNVGSKGCYDNSSFACLFKKRPERCADGTFTLRVALSFGICRIGEHTENTLSAKLCKAVNVNHTAVDGRAVDLEIAHLHDNSGLAFNGKGKGIGN